LGGSWSREGDERERDGHEHSAESGHGASLVVTNSAASDHGRGNLSTTVRQERRRERAYRAPGNRFVPVVLRKRALADGYEPFWITQEGSCQSLWFRAHLVRTAVTP
jgi:hypothetical protein